jgi:hypothetical protein
MVVTEASVAQAKANQFRRGAGGGVSAAEEGRRSGASVLSALPTAACAMARGGVAPRSAWFAVGTGDFV